MIFSKKMNIFILDKNPKKCVEYYHDKHVNKMIIESCQMLANAFTLKELKTAPKTKKGNYRKHSYLHHPCSKWVLENKSNWIWLLRLTDYLLEEYAYRFNKKHFCHDLWQWCNDNQWGIKHYIGLEIDKKPVSFVLAMPDKYKIIKDNFSYGSVTEYSFDIIKSYRKYYINKKLTWTNKKTGKVYNNKWTKRQKPKWIK